MILYYMRLMANEILEVKDRTVHDFTLSCLNKRLLSPLAQEQVTYEREDDINQEVRTTVQSLDMQRSSCNTIYTLSPCP